MIPAGQQNGLRPRRGLPAGAADGLLTRRRWVVLLLVVLCWTPAIAPGAPPATIDPPPVIELSFEPPPESRRSIEHVLRVFASGRVEAADPSGQTSGFTEQWTPQQVAELIAELESLADLDRLATARLQRDLDAVANQTGLSAEISGADVTRLKISTDERNWELACPAVGLLAARFPDVPSLQQVQALQERLANAAAVVQVGGDDAAARLARTASRHSRRHPEAPQWTPRDLAMVRVQPQGGRCLQFRRRVDGPDRPGIWQLTLIENSDQTVRVSLLPPETVAR